MPRIPGVNHLDAIRALEKAGFRIIRQGKHIINEWRCTSGGHSKTQSNQGIYNGLNCSRYWFNSRGVPQAVVSAETV